MADDECLAQNAGTAQDTSTKHGRGRLVAVEGGDCAGKTTLAKRLQHECGFTYIKFPDRTTETGKLLDRFLKGEVVFSPDAVRNERAAQLVFAANNHEGCHRILNELNAGRDVVLDRYVPSGVVYHSSAVGQDSRVFIETMNVGMPRPDLVVVLEVDPAVAAARRADFGTERNDDLAIQRGVLAGFRKFFPDATYVDASRAADEVFRDVVEATKKMSVGDVAYF